MDFSLTPREEAFRKELREWLAAALPTHRKGFPPSDDELSLHPDKSFDASLAWHRRMHEAGWVRGALGVPGAFRPSLRHRRRDL